MNESCVDPAHRATKHVRTMFNLYIDRMDILMIHIVKFIFTRALIAVCVQTIASITFGKPAVAANCLLMLVCSPTLEGKLMHRLVMLIIQNGRYYCAQGRP